MKYNVLIVEDDQDIISLLHLYLKSDGYRIFSTENGTEALKIIENDCIFGLNNGADDYLTKPFNLLLVVAHVNAQLRRFYQLG